MRKPSIDAADSYAAPVSEAPSERSTRFDRRKQAILDAAAVLINRLGLGDTTLALVAGEIGLNLKSLRYYFEKREHLMVAAFSGSIALHRELVDAAMAEEGPEARIRRFVREYYDLHARVASGVQHEFAYFSDLRALSEPYASTVYAEYNQFFRAVRSLIRTPGQSWSRAQVNARTHMLISQLSWSVAWLKSYVPDDLPRVAERVADILLNGMALKDVDLDREAIGAWPEDLDRLSQESFLRAATMLINEQGYRGASVERISATLNVTTGAFYHHNETRDALVEACFDRTVQVIRDAQDVAMASPVDGAARIGATAVGLVKRQMAVPGTMLRTTALTVVGPELRREMTSRLNLLTMRFADMLNDGLIDGSIRPCDMRIASEMVTAAINSAAELDRWVPGVREDEVAELYVRPLLRGLLDGKPANPALTSI